MAGKTTEKAGGRGAAPQAPSPAAPGNGRTAPFVAGAAGETLAGRRSVIPTPQERSARLGAGVIEHTAQPKGRTALKPTSEFERRHLMNLVDFIMARKSAIPSELRGIRKMDPETQKLVQVEPDILEGLSVDTVAAFVRRYGWVFANRDKGRIYEMAASAGLPEPDLENTGGKPPEGVRVNDPEIEDERRAAAGAEQGT